MPARLTGSAPLPPKYPVHYVIRDKTRSEDDVMRFLRAAFAADPDCIGRPDNTGTRPITVAIAVENTTAVNTLVELASPGMAAGDDPLGLQVPDDQQETPLSYNVRLLRESPRFLIHDLLDGASRDITQAFIEHKLPACSCRKCTSGWLSPRMRFRLRETAHDVYMAMLPKLDRFVEGQPLDNAILLDDTPLQFIPLAILQKGVYKPFYVGYRSAFHVIRCFLATAETIPTVQRLRQELAMGARSGEYDGTAVEYFLERGGSIKYALDMVVHLAACLSRTPLGDGSFDQRWEDGPSIPDTPASPSSVFTSPLLRSPQPATSPLLSPADSEIKRRRRSSSIRDLLSGIGKRDRRSGMLDVQPLDIEALQRRKFKDEWLASGDPGCALDDQFVGVRYLIGLHSAPRWDVDGHDHAIKREQCRLRRM